MSAGVQTLARRSNTGLHTADSRVGVHSVPLARPAADRDVERIAREILLARGHLEPGRQFGVRHLQGSETRNQPGRREGGRGGDRQAAAERVSQFAECVAHRREGAGHGRLDQAARFRQPHLPWLANEQADAQALLEQFDLIANSRLRHAQLLRGTGEALMPGRRLVGAHGTERRQLAAHPLAVLMPDAGRLVCHERGVSPFSAGRRH
jgi:hypothetical protein